MINILYVDDEPDLLDVGKLFLEGSGDIEVGTVSSAEEALGLLKEGNYDVIVSDYLMPGMDGISFLKTLRAESNDIPFILFTGRGREEVVIEALNSGADFYLQKGGEPVAQFKELEHKIKEAVRRSRAEDELKRSEQMLQLVLDSIPQNLYWKDRDLKRHVGCNKNAAIAVGLNEPQDLIGKSDHDIVDPGSAELYRADDRKVIDSGVPKINFEEKLLRLDGEVRWLRTSKVPLCDPDGSIIGVMGSYEDITERKQMEEALRRDEARNRALFELAQMSGLTAKDIAERAMERGIELSQSKIGYIAFMNEDGEVLTMQHYSKVAMEQCAIEGRPTVFKMGSTGLWAEAVRQRRPVITNDYDAPNPMKKGLPKGHVPLRKHMSVPIFDRGLVVAVVGVGNKESDYTEQDAEDISLLMDGMWRIIRKIQAEEALRDSERLYHTLFEKSPFSIALNDANGIFVDVNEKHLQLISTTRDQIIGRTPMELNYIDPGAFEMMTTSLIANGGVLDRIQRTVRSPGGRPLHMTTSSRMMQYNGKPHVLSITNDVTELVETKNKLQTKIKELDKERDRLQRIADQVPGVVYQMMIDPNGGVQFIFLSKGVEKILNAPVEKFLSCSDEIWDFVLPEDGELLMRSMRNDLENPSDWQQEFRITGAEGEVRWILGTSSPSYDDDHHAWIWTGTFTDITERKRSEGELKNVNRKLNLLSDITRHDLNNQLMILRGYLTLLEEGRSGVSFDGLLKGATASADLDPRHGQIHQDLRRDRGKGPHLARDRSFDQGRDQRGSNEQCHGGERDPHWPQDICRPIDPYVSLI